MPHTDLTLPPCSKGGTRHTATLRASGMELQSRAEALSGSQGNPVHQPSARPVEREGAYENGALGGGVMQAREGTRRR